MNACAIQGLYNRARLTALMSAWLTTGLFSQTDSVSNWNFGGYVKNLQNWVFTDQRNSLFNGGFFHNRLTVKWMPDSNWTFDAEIRNRLFYGEWVRFQPGWADMLDRDKGWADLSFVPVDRPADRERGRRPPLGAVATRALERAPGPPAHQLGRCAHLEPQRLVQCLEFSRFRLRRTPRRRCPACPIPYGRFFLVRRGPEPRARQKAVDRRSPVQRKSAAVRLAGAGGRVPQSPRRGPGLGRQPRSGGIQGRNFGLPSARPGGRTTSVSAAAGVDVTLGDSWYVNGGLLVNSRGSSANIDVFALNQSDLSPDNLMPGKISFAAGRLDSTAQPFLRRNCSLLRPELAACGGFAFLQRPTDHPHPHGGVFRCRKLGRGPLSRQGNDNVLATESKYANRWRITLFKNALNCAALSTNPISVLAFCACGGKKF